MDPKDMAKTTFITLFGTFCHLRMPFDLSNTGATIARLVYKVLSTQIGRNIEVYADDIVIKSRRAIDHTTELQVTFNNLRAARIKLNPEKHVFHVRVGKLLGFLISKRVILVNQEKN